MMTIYLQNESCAQRGIPHQQKHNADSKTQLALFRRCCLSAHKVGSPNDNTDFNSLLICNQTRTSLCVSVVIFWSLGKGGWFWGAGGCWGWDGKRVDKDEFYNKQLSNQTTITILNRLLNQSYGTFPDETWRFKYNRTFVFRH